MFFFCTYLDGKAFCSILNNLRPGSIDIEKCETMTPLNRIDYCLEVAEKVRFFFGKIFFFGY
jgi:hypothetical protein